MVYFKDISYMLSHVFFLAYIYLFLIHRYSKGKTIFICIASCSVMNLMDIFKLNLFGGNPWIYFVTTIVQISIAQLTGFWISKVRNTTTLFIGLSASNYVVIGSISASIIYIFTDHFYFALFGNIVVHIVVLLVLYFKLGAIFQKFCERDWGNNWLEMCLIPVFFFCSFSSIAFFPHTLYEYPSNILVAVFLMITMFVSYVVVLHYMDSEMKHIEEYWKNAMFESYIKGLESQKHLVEQSEQNLKVLRHDMRHYVTMIQSLLDQGEYEEIRSIAEHIDEVTKENKVQRYCDNLVVNTILSKMSELARSNGITLNMDLFIQEQIPVNEYEFAMVLANLLENAVFGTKELSAEKKYINVKIQCTKERLLIDMLNECEEKLEFDSLTGLPKSKKGKNHGLGMQSVQIFAEKLGGNIECYCEDQKFRIILFVDFDNWEENFPGGGSA